MDLFTTAHDNPSWKMPLLVMRDSGIRLRVGFRLRYRLLLIQEGAGILRFADQRCAFIAPSLICLHEADLPEVERMTDIKAHMLCFEPSLIHSSLNFENIRQEEGFDLSAYQDRFWLKPFFERTKTYNGLLNVGPATFRRTMQFVENIEAQLREQGPSWPCRSRSFLMELLFLIERIYSSPAAKEEIALPETHGEIDEVILYLHMHYQEKITISDLTKIFHMNRTTLMERFDAATGVSIMEYLIGLRVRIASMMLRDTLLPVSEIMERVGFNDMTHFGRTFRRYLGMTPSDYRQKLGWMQN